MTMQSKSLEEILKPFKTELENAYKIIKKLDTENAILKAKYELLKRGIPHDEIENMYK